MKGIEFKIEDSFIALYSHEFLFAAIFGGMVLFFFIEGFIPRRLTDENQTSRWLSNISLALFNHILIIFYTLFVAGIVFRLQPGSPLLDSFKVSDISAFFIVLATMEFVYYWLHRLYHRVPFLWRIHAVHHSDTELDVTTSHRHHPFEPMISTVLVSPVVFMLGAPLTIIIIYNLVFTALSLFSHSNFQIPEKMDKVLRLFIITPDFHRMHHSSDRQYTDSNYSGIVPWLDYLFGTATHLAYDEVPEMELGLEVLREPEDNRIDKMLMTPLTYK